MQNNSILDPVSINPYYVTGTNQLNNSSSSVQGTDTFAQLLSSILYNKANSSLNSIFDSSSNNTFGSSAYSMGTSSMSSLLGGVGSSSNESTLTLLMLYLISKNSSNSELSSALSSVFSQQLGSSYGSYSSYIQSTIPQVSGTSQALLPTNGSKPATPAVVSTVNNRSAQHYQQVIDQFNVENSQRYAIKNGSTYCNIFLWDVSSAMGAEIPHYTDPKTGAPVQYPNTSGAKAMNANSINSWLNQYGEQYGWRKVSAEEAQRYANMGMPAVTSWKNPNGHGHVQVVCPSKDGKYDSAKGVTVAQAGRKLYNYAYATQVYGSSTLKKVEYFVHV